MKKYLIRIKKFLKITKFKKGQVVRIEDGEKLRLLKFIRFNNTTSEYWEVQLVDYPNLNEKIFLHHAYEKVEVINEQR